MCADDPRDQITRSTAAFGGVVDLLYDAQMGHGFEATTPASLYAVLSLVRENLEPATEQLQDLVPRK